MTLQKRGILLYDGGCGFCTQLSLWAAARMEQSVEVRPWEAADAERYGVSASDHATEVHWVDRSGAVYGGADALVAWALAGPALWRLPALIAGAPVMINLARLIYPVLAANRSKLRWPWV